MTSCGKTEDPAIEEPNNEPVTEEPISEEPVIEEPVVTQPYIIEKVEEPVVAAKDEYYLENGDPTKGDDTSILGIPDLISYEDDNKDDLLILVNKYHAVKKGYKPDDLVYMDNSMSTYQNLELRAEAYEAYKKMYQDACDLGFDLKVCSAYRTYKTQTGLYVNSLKNRGRETTNIRSAYPGRSEHHTGLSVDITSKSMGMTLSQDFCNYDDGKWLNENCQNYGFIVRYPKGKTEITGYAFEPWHFRYVGVETAKYIMENNLTLEEYLNAPELSEQ